jgi:hypothetical protein
MTAYWNGVDHHVCRSSRNHEWERNFEIEVGRRRNSP